MYEYRLNQHLMYIARNKTTGLYINDFQEKATPETLIKNAAILGLSADNVEIIEVDEATFKQIVETEIAPIKAQIEADEAEKLTDLKNVGVIVATKLGITKEQLKKFILLVKNVDVDTL